MYQVAQCLVQYPGGAPRAVEDIKARYYSVARQLLTGRDGGAEGVGNQAIIKHPYNPEHERCALAVAPLRCSVPSCRYQLQDQLHHRRLNTLEHDHLWCSVIS